MEKGNYIVKRGSKFGFFILLMILLTGIFAVGYSQEPIAKMSAPLRSVLRSSKNNLAQIATFPETPVGLLSEDEEVFFEVFITSSLSRKQLEKLGVLVHSKVGSIYSGRINYDSLMTVALHPRVKKISLAVKTHPMLDVSAADTGTFANRLGCNAQNAWSKATGKNVVIGVVDTGIDWEHKDFIKDPDGNNQSRILYLWDQTLSAQSGESAPSISGLDYGVEYPQSWINDELAGITSGKVRSQDTGGHGTHVAGICGGDGSESDGDPPPPTYIGIAPEADFIIVKSTLIDTNVVDGVNYVFQKASELGRPAVVNLSLGNNHGPHDGTSEFETSLNNLTGAGKLIVTSAGNNQGKAVHAESIVSASGSVSCSFNVPSSPAISETWIDIWVDAGDTYNVSVTAPSSSSTGDQGPGGSDSWTLSGEGEVYIENYNNTSHPEGDQEIFIQIQGIGSGNVAAGSWSFTLTRIASGGDGAFDAWISQPQAGKVQFTTCHTEEEIISVPGTARNVLAVGAHNTKDIWTASNGNTYGIPGMELGAIAPFSSIGPSRDTPSDPGFLKPEVSAPGYVIASALSQDYTADPSAIADDGRHRITQGTSMSSPHVAGALALFLQKMPDITPAKVRDGLRVSSWEDLKTGTLPNNTWGYGKLNVYLALDEFTAAQNWALYP